MDNQVLKDLLVLKVLKDLKEIEVYKVQKGLVDLQVLMGKLHEMI
jgi:hypothetical protein